KRSWVLAFARMTGWERFRRVLEGRGSAAGPRHAALDRIGRVVVAGRRGMARDDEAVDQRLVLGREPVRERGDIIVPLLLGAGPADHGRDEAVVQHPLQREMPRLDAARLGVAPDLLRDVERLGAPLALQHARILPAGARAL